MRQTKGDFEGRRTVLIRYGLLDCDQRVGKGCACTIGYIMKSGKSKAVTCLLFVGSKTV